MIINVVYDSSVTASNFANYAADGFSSAAAEEAAFKSAIAYVVNLYDNPFTNNVTVKIGVGWGEVDGQPVTKSANSKAFFLNTDYTTVRQALINNANSSVQTEADNTLPTVAQSPFVGLDPSAPSIQLTYANAKALGLPFAYSVNDPNDYDGWVGFNSTSSFRWSFDPNSTPTGFNDFIAAAELPKYWAGPPPLANRDRATTTMTRGGRWTSSAIRHRASATFSPAVPAARPISPSTAALPTWAFGTMTPRTARTSAIGRAGAASVTARGRVATMPMTATVARVIKIRLR